MVKLPAFPSKACRVSQLFFYFFTIMCAPLIDIGISTIQVSNKCLCLFKKKRHAVFLTVVHRINYENLLSRKISLVSID